MIKNLNILNRIFATGFCMVILGSLSLLFEHTFYQYLDENGVLHESFFLPLGTFSILLGIVIISFFCVYKLILHIYKRNFSTN